MSKMSFKTLFQETFHSDVNNVSAQLLIELTVVVFFICQIIFFFIKSDY